LGGDIVADRVGDCAVRRVWEALVAAAPDRGFLVAWEE
jgi:hypothetical protein